MGNPSGDEDKGYWRFNPMGLVAGPSAFNRPAKDFTSWSHVDFMTRKLENAPKDGAFDDIPTTGLKSMWERFLKTLRRIH